MRWRGVRVFVSWNSGWVGLQCLSLNSDRMFDRHECLFDGQVESFDDIVGDHEPGLVDVGILNGHDLVLCGKDGSMLGGSNLPPPGSGFEARGVGCAQRGFDFVDQHERLGRIGRTR